MHPSTGARDAPAAGSVEPRDVVDGELVIRFLLAAAFWLVLAPLIGVVVAMKFNFVGFLGGVSWLAFGRLRPVHVMGVIFGGFTTAIFGLTYYIVPRLCGVRMYRESWSRAIYWLWNVGLVLGLVSLPAGQNIGIEAGEFPLWVNIPVEIVFIMISIQIVMTIIRRREQRIYVSLWYLTAGYIWTVFNYAFGHFLLPYSMPGVNNAAMHGLYIHHVVGLWITPAGLAVIYYFLPLAAERPLYSHKLSHIGFWSLAFFYPFVGTHHYIYSPIPYWTQTIAIVTSMMLIIPVWTVIQNFFGTFASNWKRFLESYTARFLIVGAVAYLFGCLQGSFEALREVQRLTHFTDFVIAHSHLTVFGTFILWVTAGMYYVIPRLSGRELWSKTLAEWHYWLTVAGFSTMIAVLVLQGVMQGTMLEAGADFVDSMVAMKAYWLARTLAGATMEVGAFCGMWNFYMTVRQGKRLEGREGAPAGVMPEPHWT